MSEPRRVCSRCGESYDPDVIFCPKDGTPLGARRTEVSDDPYLDLTVAGQFRIQQLIGIGAMGRVYRAHQKGIERDVAIKILHRELLRNPTVLARFHREAKVASRLMHPNVVQVLMTGELERQNADVGGEGYIVMEHLDGISLRSALAAAGGAMPLPRTLHVILQVCDAVGEAHAQGIVHRDLKPENVMLVRRGDDRDFVKVLDFGVARIDWADSSVATQAGVIFGTARYISPEGAQGARVGAAGDVYSIATMLFQCLSGSTPFDGDNPVAILIKHTNEAPPDVRSIPRSSYVPEPLARVIAANLAKDPAERCRDARELGRALADAARDCGLNPSDLVRSTLLGDSQRALAIASIERTRSLGLTPDLAAKLAGGSTQVDPGTSTTRASEPDAERRSAPDTAVDPEPSAGRRSNVEPTLADEPSSELLSSSRTSAPPSASRSSAPPSGPGDTAAPASIPPGSSPGFERLSSPGSYRDSLSGLPDHVIPDAPGSRVRRALMVTAFFLLGGGLALLIASRLGAFDTHPEPTLASYEQRARAAAIASAWDSPPGENVKDITDAALQRWPHAPSIRRVRQDSARTLTRIARSVSGPDHARALRLLGLALDLDPTNSDARALMDKLDGADSPAASSSAAATGSAALPPPHHARHSTHKRSEPAPKTPAAPKPAPTEPQSPPPAPTSTGGRWL